MQYAINGALPLQGKQAGGNRSATMKEKRALR
jgi:hypothetical protein